MNKRFYVVISVFIAIIIWISIALSDSYYTSYNLRLRITDVPENFTPSINIPEFINIKIKADGWTLLPLEFGGEKYFNISAKNDSSKLSENLVNFIQMNSWYNNKMNIIEINPRVINVNIEPKVESLVKVIPDIYMEFKRGFGLASEIVLEPDSVLIKGPSSEINKIKEINTEKISLIELDEPIEIIASLNLPKGFYSDIEKVKIYLDIQRIIDNTIADVPVIVENVPKNIEIVIIPKTVNLTLRGGINYFSNYNKGEILARVDYNDIINDTLGYLRPDIQIPKNFNLISTNPDVVRYIIKKY